MEIQLGQDLDQPRVFLDRDSVFPGQFDDFLRHRPRSLGRYPGGRVAGGPIAEGDRLRQRFLRISFSHVFQTIKLTKFSPFSSRRVTIASFSSFRPSAETDSDG